MKKSMIYVLCGCLVMVLAAGCKGRTQQAVKRTDTIALAPCPRFVADSAMASIRTQCHFGPRVTGSEAHQQCMEYIVDKFRQYGAQVRLQQGNVTLYDGSAIKATNIIASLNVENPDRLLICAHWDSRPWADNDPEEANHRTPVPAANDGASGVAVMLEMARLMQQQPIRTGIDFVCFDAEDMGTPRWAEDEYDSDDTWCLGSRMWAQKAREEGYMARYGILMDMVGGRGCTFAQEMVSKEFAGPVVDMLWQLAAQIGYSHFFPRTEGAWLMDDHVNVNRLARIPCLDIVPHFTDGPSSFGPTWHTVNDTPENIDPNVLEAVGQSILQLLYNDNAQ